MERVGDGIYRLGSRMHNFYVFVDGGAATVVDAGASREWRALVAGLRSIDLTPGAVKGVLLTHAHADHIGFAARAATQGIPVYTHSMEAAAARGERVNHAASLRDMPIWKPAIWIFLATMLRAGAHTMKVVDEVEAVVDGQTIDLPGSPEVVFAPGHTPGHAAFYFADRRVACTGDALASLDVLGGPPGPQLMPDAFHDDPSQARESLTRLARLDTDLILPGHGRPLHGQLAEVVAHL